MTWHAGQDLQRLERKSVFIYLFICHGAVPCSTTPAIHQRHILCGFAQERNSHSSGSKSLQVYEKRDNRQMSSKTWQKIWSAALKITDLRKCLFWKTMCQSGTSPLASKLRYAINSIKSKQRCHLNTQRTYFTLTIKMFLPYCFVLNWNLSKLVYPAEFFNFAESSFFQ